MNDFNFGNFIYQLRTEKGLSQSQLGDMMGVSNKAVSKWEMGVSKPRPDMLVALASFFGVTVEELLAGKRNPQAQQKKEEKDDTSLKLWAGEYRLKRKHGANTVATALVLPLLMFLCAGVILSINPSEKIIGPIITMLFFFAEAIDIALIFFFYGSARRVKRLLYATYPEQAEEITAIINRKRERLPMLKWEKICVITGVCIVSACQLLRIIAYGFVELKVWRIITTISIFILISVLILEIVALSHYLLRQRHKE